MKRKRNRKKQSQGFVFPMPLALFLVLATVICMSYLWLQTRCEAAGVRLQQLEREFEQAGRMLQQEQRKWAQMKTLPNVRAAVERHGLQMELASGRQVVQLIRAKPEAAVRPLPGDMARNYGIGMND